MKKIFNKSLNKIYQSVNSLFLIIGLLTFIGFSTYYAKAESPSIQLLFQIFVLLIIWFIVYSMSSYYLYYHFENFKTSKKSIVTGIALFIFMIFFCLLILLLGSVINDSTLLPSEKMANVFDYIILISNIVLVIFTGANLFLTNQKSQNEFKEKNIRSDIEFYQSQLKNYYLPLYTEFNSLAEQISNEYSNIQYGDDKIIFNNIDHSIRIIKEITLQYAFLNTEKMNSLMDKKSNRRTYFWMVMRVIMEYVENNSDQIEDEKNAFNEIISSLDPEIIQKNLPSGRKVDNLNDYLIVFIIEISQYKFIEEEFKRGYFKKWYSLRADVYKSLLNNISILIYGELMSSIQIINDEITKELKNLEILHST